MFWWGGGWCVRKRGCVAHNLFVKTKKKTRQGGVEHGCLPVFTGACQWSRPRLLMAARDAAARSAVEPCRRDPDAFLFAPPHPSLPSLFPSPPPPPQVTDKDVFEGGHDALLFGGATMQARGKRGRKNATPKPLRPSRPSVACANAPSDARRAQQEEPGCGRRRIGAWRWTSLTLTHPPHHHTGLAPHQRGRPPRRRPPDRP